MTEHLPDWLINPLITSLGWLPDSQKYAWLDVVLQVLVVLLIVVLGDRFGVPILLRLARHLPFSHRLLVQCRRALRVAAFFLLLQIIFRDIDPTLHLSPLLLHLSALLTIASLTWLLTRAVQPLQTRSSSAIRSIRATTSLHAVSIRKPGCLPVQ